MSDSYVRPDGRSIKQLRDLKVEVGILDRAEGSARVNLGKNIAIATVFGPREMHPKHAARSDRAVVRVNYRMATFSVDGYKRSFPSRREKEISKVLSEAFDSVVLTKNWPRSVVDVHIEIFQSDGGTRTAAAIAITSALADAGIPMRDLTGGIASGLYDDKVVLDLNGHEDMKGTGDMPILYSPSIDEISLFQLDGKFTLDQFKEAFYQSMDGIREIVKVIQDALKEKYLAVREKFGVDDEDESSDMAYVDEDDHETHEDDDDEDEDDFGSEYVEKTYDEDIPSSSFAVKTAPVGNDDSTANTEVVTASELNTQEEVVEEPMDEPSTNEMASDEETTTEIEATTDESNGEDEIKNTWFNKPGATLRPMGGSKKDDEDDDDESSSVIRDLEYMEDE